MARDGQPTPLTWVRLFFTHVLFPQSMPMPAGIRRSALALVVLLPALLLYPTMNFYLLEPDEGRYAQIPKEMLQSGQWVVPTLMGEPYLDKPPLFYWLVALSYKCFGISEASARLVPALAVHLTILVVYLLGRRSLGERPAFWAAMLLTVAPGYLGVARFLVLDGLLTFCITTSILCGFEAVRTGIFRRKWWIMAAVFSGLGFLTKGPISEVLFFPPLMVFGWLTQRSAKVRWFDVLLFAGVVIGVNLPWYIAMVLQRPEFLGYFFWEHNVMRFVKPFDHLQPVWYYVPVLLLGFLPGVLLGIPYIVGLLRGDNSTRTRMGGFWLLAGLWCMLFFSISGSKLPTYILPAFPSLMLGFGAFLASTKWGDARATRATLGTMAALMLLANYALIPWYANKRSPMRDPDLIARYCDPDTTIVCFPRQINSLAFYLGRDDLDSVRSKNAPEMVQGLLKRKKTVILCTHRHSFEALRYTFPAPLRITASESFADKHPGWLDRLVGETPWGLCHVIVVERD